MYAITGTFIATFITSVLVYMVGKISFVTSFDKYEAFAFGSLISATDPVAVLSIFKDLKVNKTLFALIFGESILNNAVAMILFEYYIFILTYFLERQ